MHLQGCRLANFNEKLLFVVGFTLLLPAPPSSPIDKFPFCIKQEQTQHFTLTC